MFYRTSAVEYLFGYMKHMPSLEFIIKELGYTESWLRLGVVDTEFVQRQYAEFCASDDKNQEHYRAGAFARYLRLRDRLSDEDIEAIWNLTDDGPDGSDLRLNRIMDLLATDLLTDSQMTGLARFPEVSEPPLQKRYQRCILTRTLNKDGLTDSVFKAMCRSRDSVLHSVVLSRCDLRRNHLEWLAENGGNKAVRNQATQMLRSKRFHIEE
jgi:hypothetical protein